MAEYTANPNVNTINQGVNNIEIDSRPLQNSGVVNSSGSYPLATGLQSSTGVPVPLGGSAGIPNYVQGTTYSTTSYPAESTQVTYSTSNQPITGVTVNPNAELYQAAVIPANSSYEQHQVQGFSETHRAGPARTHFVEENVEILPVVPPMSTLTYSDAVQVNYIQNPQQSLEGRWRNRLNAITLAHNAHETQNGFYEKLLARHQFNLEQTGYVNNYFHKRADASRAYAKALTAMPKLYNNAYGTPIPQHGSLESVLERVADVNTVEAAGHHKLAESLDLHNQQKFGAYHTHIKNAHSTLTEGHKVHTRRLGQLRNNADRSLNQWSSNASIPAGEHYKPTYDPWLRETRFLHHYTAYRNGLDEYNTFLEEQFVKTAESDVYRSNMLKAALIEVLRLQQSLTVHQLNTSLDTGIQAVDSSTIGPDFHKYAYSSGLTKIQHEDHGVLRDNFSSNLPRAYRTDALDVNDDFDYYAYKKMGMPPPLHHRNYVPTSDYTHDVEHIGQLDMSSRKGSTKPYLWVLSKYGYLHQFNANKLDKPKMSIAAKYCNVSPADSHGDFKIDYKQPGLHTRHNFYVRAANQAEGQIWQQKIANAAKTATYQGQY